MGDKREVARLLTEAGMMETVKEFAKRFGDNGKLPGVAVQMADGRTATTGIKPMFKNIQRSRVEGMRTKKISINSPQVVQAAYECLTKKSLFLHEGERYWVKALDKKGQGTSARITAVLERADYVNR